jgi:hypothetical protein
VSRLARITLYAYPRSFRDRFGAEYVQTIADLRRHDGHRSVRTARLLMDALVTAPAMRWECLMNTTRVVLPVVTAVAAAAAVVIGAPFVALPLLVILAALVVAARRHDQPLAVETSRWAGRWVRWLVAGAGLFLLGLTVLAVDGDDELSTVAWAIWLLSWIAGGVVAAVGVGLGATRLLGQRRV